MRLPHSLIIVLAALASIVSGALTNTTVDDSSSSFSWSGEWTAVSPSSPCDFCASKPDPSQTNGGTWHDGNTVDNPSRQTTGSFTFKGSAVYIYGLDQTNSQPSIAFTLDNIQKVHRYTGSERFAYHALFFSADGLASDQTHTVNWVYNFAQNTGVGVQSAIFDYAIVTTGQEDQAPPPPPPPPPPTSSTQPPSNDPGPSGSTGGNDNSPPNQPSGNNSNSNPNKSGSPTSPPSGSAPSGSAASITNNNGLQNGLSHSTPIGQATSGTVTVSGTTTVTALTASSTSRPPIGAIIGGVVGGIAVLALAVWFICRRGRSRETFLSEKPDGDARTQSRFLSVEDYRTRSRQAQGLAPSQEPLTAPSTLALLTDPQSPDTPNTPSTSASASVTASSFSPPSFSAQSRSSSSNNLRWMEERIASLEAQVALQEQPPPPAYGHET
ncbi:hypothetical protein R3P38DRAFT_3001757 [Favolaschia claudopus]|uniref:Uncharacterized protein n=1 Tax=Favolaschia claudopus TaxID=2862362 RepID=A0AAW0AMM1_9AGAR